MDRFSLALALVLPVFLSAPSVEANTPSKFARIVVSRTPFEKGTPMP